MEAVVRVFKVEEDHFDYDFQYNLDEKKIIKDNIGQQTSINIDDLRRIALWKYDRIIDVDDEFLIQLYSVVSGEKVSIDDLDVQKIINDLVACTGIGYPLASTILKFINPQVFPIIDVRAYRAVFGKRIYSSQHSLMRYVEYTRKLYEISSSLGIPLEEVDEKLYVYDKIFNGKL